VNGGQHLESEDEDGMGVNGGGESLKKLKLKRLQSRERRGQVFTQRMDEKMNEYNERLRNGYVYQSSGVKGVFGSNFKQTSFQGNNAFSSNGGGSIGHYAPPNLLLKPSYYPSDLSGSPQHNYHPSLGGGAHLSTLSPYDLSQGGGAQGSIRGNSRMGNGNSFRTPQVSALKIDKINNRLVINDDRILQGIMLSADRS
jgi:hypothetical protein